MSGARSATREGAVERSPCRVFLARLADEARSERLVDALVAKAISPERRARTERLRKVEDRSRSVFVELLLRKALASWPGTGSIHPVIARTAEGAPYVANLPGVRISLSHSGDLVACALAPEPVGVDVQESALPDLSELLPGSCSPAEAAALASVDPAERTRAFLKLWTGKESAAKCLGLGMGLDFRGMGFADWPILDSAVVRTGLDAPLDLVYLDFLPAGPGYAACAARRSPGSPPGVTEFGWRELLPFETVFE